MARAELLGTNFEDGGSGVSEIDVRLTGQGVGLVAEMGMDRLEVEGFSSSSSSRGVHYRRGSRLIQSR